VQLLISADGFFQPDVSAAVMGSIYSAKGERNVKNPNRSDLFSSGDKFWKTELSLASCLDTIGEKDRKISY
jgi:hypothetical protein